MILTLSCPDQRGIVARVSTRLLELGCNIVDAQQHGDPDSGRFFMRVVFESEHDVEALRSALSPLASSLAMTCSLRDPRVKQRVMLLASKSDHASPTSSIATASASSTWRSAPSSPTTPTRPSPTPTSTASPSTTCR